MNPRYTLYRAYSRSGRLLYIGLTKNLEQRMANHRTTSAWYSLCANVTTCDLGEDVVAAKAAESTAILMDQPEYNVKDKALPLPKMTAAELTAAGLVPPNTATRLAGIGRIPHPYWRRFIKPVARGYDGIEYFDPEYCQRMATAPRERLTFVHHLDHGAAGFRRLVKAQVATANREAADSVRGAA